jgi:hypothetical protein
MTPRDQQKLQTGGIDLDDSREIELGHIRMIGKLREQPGLQVTARVNGHFAVHEDTAVLISNWRIHRVRNRARELRRE